MVAKPCEGSRPAILRSWQGRRGPCAMAWPCFAIPKLSNGEPLVAGKPITGFANSEDDFADQSIREMGTLPPDRHGMPWHIDDELKGAGRHRHPSRALEGLRHPRRQPDHRTNRTSVAATPPTDHRGPRSMSVRRSPEMTDRPLLTARTVGETENALRRPSQPDPGQHWPRLPALGRPYRCRSEPVVDLSYRARRSTLAESQDRRRGRHRAHRRPSRASTTPSARGPASGRALKGQSEYRQNHECGNNVADRQDDHGCSRTVARDGHGEGGDGADHLFGPHPTSTPRVAFTTWRSGGVEAVSIQRYKQPSSSPSSCPKRSPP